MNVRIFYVLAMECMCAQSRPQFILLCKRGLGMKSEPMLTPREEFPLQKALRKVEPVMLHREPNTPPTELFQPQWPVSDFDHLDGGTLMGGGSLLTISGWVMSVTSKLVLCWLPTRISGIIDRVSIKTGRPGVSILWLVEIASSICNLCPSVSADTRRLGRSVLEIHSSCCREVLQPRNTNNKIVMALKGGLV